MRTAESVAEPARLSIRNIGGISETEVELSPGITVLVGRNATNRTSFLQAIMAVMGSDDVSMKGDAEQASVELTLGEEEYRRTFHRRDGTVVTEGTPYLDDPDLADLFAFLLHTNEARQAVIQQDDLHDLLMRPVDTASIEADIERLKAERREVDAELSRLDGLQDDLPELERRRNDLETAIEEKRNELDETEAAIERMDATVEEERSENAELERRLERLQDVRSDLEDVRFEVETERDSLDALHDRHDDLRDELDEFEDETGTPVEELDARIDRLRAEKEEVSSAVDELQTVVQFNREMLEGRSSEVGAALREGDDEEDESGAVTNRLLEDDGVVCWTCGSEVERERIETTLSHLEDLRREKHEERRELESRVEQLQREKRRRERTAERRREIRGELDRIEAEIAEREERIESLTDRREELEGSVSELEAEVEELRTEDQSEMLDRHKEVNELEFELGRMRDELDEVRERIADIDDELERRADVESRRETIEDELTELRTRIDRIERSAVEGFNEHMETVLDLLEYDNIDRVWIERVERTVAEGRRTVDETAFELHVVRSTESGAGYEDTVEHLSESEREVTGLVFALAGYLVHDVHETVPFMLLDSLETIDADRIASLVAYFGEYASYLVVALLPEDASAVEVEHRRVTDI